MTLPRTAAGTSRDPQKPRRDKGPADESTDNTAALLDLKLTLLAQCGELKSQMTAVELRLTDEVASLRERMQQRDEEHRAELAKVEGKAQFAMNELMDLEERTERAANVMLRGLDVDIANPSQQALAAAVVTALTQENTGIALATEEVEEVVRLGPDFFKVRFKDVRTRRKVLRRRHAVRTATGNKLRVQEDLTRLQQANIRRLQPVFELLRDKARAEGRWTPFFRAGLLYHHVGPVVPDQPQKAQLHEANWDPTVLAAAIHERGHAVPAASGPHASPSASRQA